MPHATLSSLSAGISRRLAKKAAGPVSVDSAADAARRDPVTAGNAEPGFANTYTPGSSQSVSIPWAAAPAVGVGGIGLLLLYQRYLQDKRDREKQLSLKQASLDSMMAHMPGMHPKDMLLGAAAGGGAGLLYDLVKGQPEGRRTSTTLKRLLAGAGIGAVGGNIFGDRARRYVSNTVLPFSYDSGSLMPRSVQHVVDAAFLDKPSYDPAAVAKLPDSFGGSKEVADTALSARRELVRRSMNLHRDSADTDIWQRNKGVKGPDHFSLNEKNKNYESFLKRLFLPSRLHPVSPQSVSDPAERAALKDALPGSSKTVDRDISPIFRDPANAVRAMNAVSALGPGTDGWRNRDLFGANTLVGEQQVMARPGSTVQGTVLDRFDVTPGKADTSKLLSEIKNLNVFRPSWYGKPADTSAADYYSGQTNAGWLKSLLSRLVWDKGLVEEHPWVSQKFQFTPQEDGGNALQFQNAQGNPVSQPMSADALSVYLMNLQKQK